LYADRMSGINQKISPEEQTNMMPGILNYMIVTLAALFPIANPIGAVPVFCSLTETDTRLERKKAAQQIVMNVVVILAGFLLGGRAVLEFFGISLNLLRIAGGLLVSHAAWEMVTSHQRLTDAEQRARQPKEDITFTPMAIPLIAGPGSIGVVIGLATKMTQWSDYLGCLIGILLFGGLLYICLMLGKSLLSRLGRNGWGALNRILGFFILAIAVQLIADGVISLVQAAMPKLFN
jgi:multiple antibiotic resistance protein